jgi:ATP/maltotriose-dependent transcriptional regulator MalT
VLDDAHLAASAPEIALLIDRMVALAPADLHNLIAGRQPLSLPNLSRWKAQGMVLHIDRAALAFNAAEIAALFSEGYGYELTADEADLLYEATEGWAIALQLVWQSLRSEVFVSVEEVLSNQAASLDSLFHVLATEIFEGQPADVQAFLRATSVLRAMTPEACNAVQIGGPSLSAAIVWQRRPDYIETTGNYDTNRPNPRHRQLRAGARRH